MIMNQSSLKPNFGARSPAHGGMVSGMPQTPLTPMSLAAQAQQQNQNSGAVSVASPNTISLSLLIDFIVQRTYHDLSILSELLPRKTDMERKQEIYNFAARTRLLAVRLLALVKWASSASKVDKSVHIMNFLEKQSMLFIDTADIMSKMARETLVHARLPNFHIPAAVEVMTTGSYNRLPTCIRERIVPPDPVTQAEKKSTLAKLSQVIQHRLVTTDLPLQMRNLKIDQGRVTFTVDNEFEASLTVLGDSPTVPWKIIGVELLVEDRDIGDGMSLVHPLQSGYLLQLAQSRMDLSSYPLKELYSVLHAFAQTLQLEVLYTQALKLCRERLDDYLTIDDYIVGKQLTLKYWKDLSALDPKAELGYRIIITVDAADPDQPLGVTHNPPLVVNEAEKNGEGMKSTQLEKILVHTVYLRSRNRLAELKKELELVLGADCTLQGSPPVLSVPILSPTVRSEQLLVAVNCNTGSFLVHIPQFSDPSPPLVAEIQATINTMNMKIGKLTPLISQLRYWITERRCEKTLQHLPANGSNRIRLIKMNEHPILKDIGPHHLTIKFQKHPYAILILEFKEKLDCPSEMEYVMYLIMVKKASAEENEDAVSSSAVGTAPKFYLRPTAVLPLDTFVATHGAFTEVDVLDPSERIMGKRKLGSARSSDQGFSKKQKHPAYFVPELAHIVAMCDERLPFALLSAEFTKHDIIHGGCRVEAKGVCLSVPILMFPTPPAIAEVPKIIIDSLHDHLDSATVRYQIHPKGSKTWNLEFRFMMGMKLMGRVIPKLENPVIFSFEMAIASDEHILKIVNYIMDEWVTIVKLYNLMTHCHWLKRLEQSGAVLIKSYTWNRVTINYGPNRSASMDISYSVNEQRFKIHFGGTTSHNPHTIMRGHIEKVVNAKVPCNLDTLFKHLNETYDPLYSLSKLPTNPQLGMMVMRPQIPVASFVLLPQSPCHVRVVYMNHYCLDIHFQSEGLISIRDGAYSLFDKSVCVGDFVPMQNPKAFLMKYVDESVMFRRRSQSEDDNPPSPTCISTMLGDLDSAMGSQSSFLSAKPQSPAGRSNPLTPASPHIQPAPVGFSPASSGFANVASPPQPLSHLSQPSPNPMHHPAPSPSGSLLPAPSPLGGPMSVPTPSPNPGASSNITGGVGTPGPGSNLPASGIPSIPSHPSPFFHAAEASPAPVNSPWGQIGSVGSPGMPRPSPASARSQMDPRPLQQANRVLPSRSWAGAVPTILTQDALDILCTPTSSVDNVPGTEGSIQLPGIPCCPLERFLGSSYLRRQLQRMIQSDEFKKQLEIIDARGPGFILFRSSWMQFRVGHDINHHQTLHLKVTPAMSNDPSEQWSQDEVHLLEQFFATKVAAPPFRTNGLTAFARLVSCQPKILRDILQIIRLQLYPSCVEQQNWKWHVQLCLTVPHCAMPIIPQGMPAIYTSATKILIYLHLTRVGSNQPGDQRIEDPERTPFVIVPLVYESAPNSTQLAEKRGVAPVSNEYAAITHHLRRFTEMNQASFGDRCSVFPTVQDLVANLVLPPDNLPGGLSGNMHQQHLGPPGGPGGQPQMPPGLLVRPPGPGGQHFQGGQPGMGMM